MSLKHYYTEHHGKIMFSRQQASDFAKQVANDFNPLHDIDAKRFCVPGDLLFSIALSKIGLSQHMHVSFSDMVTDGVDLNFPDSNDSSLSITDSNDKAYLSIDRGGDSTQGAALIETLARRYVEFSGKTFPHILVPLWKQQNVMVNPARPLVIYESMTIDLDRLDIKDPNLEMADASLDVSGKRGKVKLAFNIKSGDTVVGKGEKRLVLSGLREYDQESVDGVETFYNDRKVAYQNAKAP